MHSIFTTSFNAWSEVEAAIASLGTTTEQGDAFEQFAAFYFKYFEQIYEINSAIFPKETGRGFPSAIRTELNLGAVDYGIDGVCSLRRGGLMAVQVKFRSQRDSISFRDLATFWSEAYRADQKMVFTNGREITRVAERRAGHLEVTLAQLVSLDADFFRALQAYALDASAVARIAKKEPRPYQTQAFDDVIAGFETADRGKLIAACGIGKTLVALWISERIGSNTVLFLAPNLQLIRQTLVEWAVQAEERFDFLAVCSDSSVAEELDTLESLASQSDFPTTTDPEVISRFLSEGSARRVVFCTYQSLPAVVNAISALDSFTFDLTIFDEAHKTAGTDSSTGFSIGLDDSHLPSSKRLFMTATERLYTPRALDKAAEAGALLFSMDDESIYGRTFHRITFKEAIAESIICDYRIVLAAVTRSELQATLDQFGILRDEDVVGADAMPRETFLASLVLSKAFAELDVHKIVSYHPTVRAALQLAEVPLGPGVVGLHINGSMGGGTRSQIIDEFKDASNAVLTNARCLVEGVDIPLIDGVCFATPRSSLIDIVQAVGRALRQPWQGENTKVAKIVIPAVVDDSGEFSDGDLEGLYNVIQALRDQDESLAQTIDEMNLRVSRGETPRRGGGRDVVSVLAIGDISVKELSEALELRIADVNSLPGQQALPRRTLGAGQRASVDRRIRTLADYTPEMLEESLIRPTVAKFDGPRGDLRRDEIRINNNNVGHAEKLGVIQSNAARLFNLTEVGARYSAGEAALADVIRNQILIYRDKQSGRYPYRLVLEFMMEMGRLTHWDFLFGIYSSSPLEIETDIVANATARARSVAQYAAAATVATDENKSLLTAELNERTGLNLLHNDIWTDRTSAFNQFRYFLRHFELFDTVFDAHPRELVMSGSDGKQKIEDLLDRSARGLDEGAYGNFWWQ